MGWTIRGREEEFPGLPLQFLFRPAEQLTRHGIGVGDPSIEIEDHQGAIDTPQDMLAKALEFTHPATEKFRLAHIGKGQQDITALAQSPPADIEDPIPAFPIRGPHEARGVRHRLSAGRNPARQVAPLHQIRRKNVVQGTGSGHFGGAPKSVTKFGVHLQDAGALVKNRESHGDLADDRLIEVFEPLDSAASRLSIAMMSPAMDLLHRHQGKHFSVVLCGTHTIRCPQPESVQCGRLGRSLRNHHNRGRGQGALGLEEGRRRAGIATVQDRQIHIVSARQGNALAHVIGDQYLHFGTDMAQRKQGALGVMIGVGSRKTARLPGVGKPRLGGLRLKQRYTGYALRWLDSVCSHHVPIPNLVRGEDRKVPDRAPRHQPHQGRTPETPLRACGGVPFAPLDESSPVRWALSAGSGPNNVDSEPLGLMRSLTPPILRLPPRRLAELSCAQKPCTDRR